MNGGCVLLVCTLLVGASSVRRVHSFSRAPSSALQKCCTAVVPFTPAPAGRRCAAGGALQSDRERLTLPLSRNIMALQRASVLFCCCCFWKWWEKSALLRVCSPPSQLQMNCSAWLQWAGLCGGAFSLTSSAHWLCFRFQGLCSVSLMRRND